MNYGGGSSRKNRHQKTEKTCGSVSRLPAGKRGGLVGLATLIAGGFDSLRLHSKSIPALRSPAARRLSREHAWCGSGKSKSMWLRWKRRVTDIEVVAIRTFLRSRA